MKKTYLSPSIDLLDAESEELLNASFNEELDNKTSISTDDMLSRRGNASVWDDEDDDE